MPRAMSIRSLPSRGGSGIVPLAEGSVLAYIEE
jgi:hypothetical protein